MSLLAQIGQTPPAPQIHFLFEPLAILFTVGSILYWCFWLWMLIHCIRTEPDRGFWLWLLIVAQGVGPLAYFFARYLPSAEFRAPSFLRRFTRGRELTRLETAALQIGNAHQFVQWGDALRDVGQWDKAASAYAQALQKDASSLPALWGATLVAEKQQRHQDIRTWTRTILDRDPQYKFGDVSLAHGKALLALGEQDQAVPHLEEHVRRWRHPESLYLLAKVYADRGDTTAARTQLQGLLLDINGSPAAIARRYGR